VRRGVAITVAAALLTLVAGCRKTKPLTPNLNVENKVAVRPIVVFYEAPTMLLASETRSVALPENPAGALSVVVRELMKGSANPSLPPLFPADTVVRGAFLLPDGTAFVDLGGPTLSGGWGTGTHRELMAIYSVVQTVTVNFAEAKRVRILINDQPAETLAGHISLAHALVPMPSLVTAAVAPPPQPASTVAPPPAPTGPANCARSDADNDWPIVQETGYKRTTPPFPAGSLVNLLDGRGVNAQGRELGSVRFKEAFKEGGTKGRLLKQKADPAAPSSNIVQHEYDRIIAQIVKTFSM
jgi:hypothetical protein